MQNPLAANIYLFNPTCEYAIANGTVSWQPNRILQKMEADLATLPLFFAQPNDKVVVQQLPTEGYLEHLQKVGFQPPGFILKENLNATKIDYPINKLLPWGWSPAAHKLFSPIKANCSTKFKASPVFNWQAVYKDLYSKKFARGIQKEIVTRFPSKHFIDYSQLTEICTTRANFEYYIKKWDKLMVKAPWSSSGRGLQPIRFAPIHPKVWDKILAMVREQGYAIVEPYLDKVIDLAFQFKLEKGKASYVGISNFRTDYKGKYDGNSLNGLPDTLEEEVKTFIEKIPRLVINPLIEILETSPLALHFEGYFGVDTLIYKDETGTLKVNPCLEINVRYNMGLLSLYVEKFIVPHKKAAYHTWFQPGTTFYNFKKEMEQKYPLVLRNNKIESGFFTLSDVREDTQFGAYLLV